MNDQAASNDHDQIEDCRWAALVAKVIHPIDVLILEAFAWISKSLSERDLFDIIGGRVSARAISARMKHLCRLGALEISGTPVGRERLDIPYCLADCIEQETDGG
jgi:hypothetical protein